jgi:asparagine synthase (glutamine-hydrolysing)
MCGIAGFVESQAHSREPYDTLSSMLRTIRHRGPDDWGMVFNGYNGGRGDAKRVDWRQLQGPLLALGHQRLAILDLSEAGRQPMWSHDGAYCISYNGEIYNYLELRSQLAPRAVFQTGTDTEVLLEAYRQWGTAMLQQLDGMFAFALWDRKAQTVVCARDPIGIKPFYYGTQAGRFVFASEPRAVLAGLRTRGRIDAVRVAEFLALGVSDHDDGTSYEEVRQLLPGHWIAVDAAGSVSPPRAFWSVPDEPVQEADVPRLVRDHIDVAIARQLRSDVPVGSCLSGGLDSGTVTSAAARALHQDAANFTALTLTNPDFEGDETEMAAATAAKTGVKWTKVQPRLSSIVEELDQMIQSMDEPFPSLSMFGQRKIMEQASALGLKVMLDGQGGDEVFLGYLRLAQRVASEYFWQGSLSNAFGEWQALGRNASQPVWLTLASSCFFGSPAIVRRRNTRRVSKVVDANFLQHVRPNIVREMYTSLQGVRGLQIAELKRFCLPQLLRYEDRNSMAHSVEARVPLLAVPIVEIGLGLPLNWKVRGGWTKYALRRAMQDDLPAEILWSRRKRGFEVPQKLWVESARSSIEKWLHDLPPGCPVSGREILKAIDNGKAGEQWVWRCLSVALWIRSSGVGA